MYTPDQWHLYVFVRLIKDIVSSFITRWLIYNSFIIGDLQMCILAVPVENDSGVKNVLVECKKQVRWTSPLVYENPNCCK